MTHPDKVITESQRIAEALEKIAHEYGYFVGLAYGDTDGNLAVYKQGRAIKEMSKWVMDYAHTDWSKNVRHGVSLGRSDAVAMLQSVLKPSTIDVPASEIRKIITALRSVSMEDL